MLPVNRLPFYEAGSAGVPEDWIEAAKWYQEGAQLGWRKAQQSLGRACQYGIGVPLDLSAAVDWYRRVAAAGNSQARYFAEDAELHPSIAHALKTVAPATAIIGLWCVSARCLDRAASRRTVLGPCCSREVRRARYVKLRGTAL